MNIPTGKIRLRARRGLKELDVYLAPFAQNIDTQSDKVRTDFWRLLGCEDPDLLDWFLGEPPTQFADIIALIKRTYLADV